MALKASAATGPTPGTVINRLQTVLSFTIDNSFSCSTVNCSRSFSRAASNASMMSRNSGMSLERSRMRSANLPAPTMPTLRPKLRNKPRMSFSMAMALFLKQLAGRQQRPALLARQRLDMHRPEQVNPHHLGDAAGIVAAGLVDLRLEKTPLYDGFRCRSQVVQLPSDY